MAAARTSRIAVPGGNLVSSWPSAFTTRAVTVPRLRVQQDLSCSRKGFVTLSTPSKKQYPRGHWSDESLEATKATTKPSLRVTPTASSASRASAASSLAKSSLTFDHRLKYLSGSSGGRIGSVTSTASQKPSSSLPSRSPNRYPPASPTAVATTPIPTRRRRRTGVMKRYWAGFQAGDFICPQCGSHNFQPPGGHSLESTEFAPSNEQQRVRRAQREHSSDAPLSPTMRDTSVSIYGKISAEQNGHSEAERHLTKSDTNPEEPPVEPERLSRRRQKEQLQQRKYPLGAMAHCFECGFETSYETPMVSPPSTTSSASTARPTTASQPTSSHGPTADVKTATGLTSDLRADIRLAKPRDYVCPQCLTVNYNNRLHCVGCGSIAPWIREKVEAGLKTGSRGADIRISSKGSFRR